MDFRVTEILNHPVENVYRTYRDRLPDLVPFLPNVDALESIEREEKPTGVRLLNRWKVSGAFPRAVRPFFSDKMLTYLDRAEWIDADTLVNWSFEIGIFPEAVECHGTNTFRPGSTAQTTEVALSGKLLIDLAKVRGVPRLLQGFAPTVERFLLERVKPNLSEVARAVGRFLDEGKR